MILFVLVLMYSTFNSKGINDILPLNLNRYSIKMLFHWQNQAYPTSNMSCFHSHDIHSFWMESTQIKLCNTFERAIWIKWYLCDQKRIYWMEEMMVVRHFHDFFTRYLAPSSWFVSMCCALFLQVSRVFQQNSNMQQTLILFPSQFH